MQLQLVVCALLLVCFYYAAALANRMSLEGDERLTIYGSVKAAILVKIYRQT
jgi:hypothetical protein